MNHNWEWVRATYSLSEASRPTAVDDSIPYPSCLANGLSPRQKRALLQVYTAACERAEVRLGQLRSQIK